MTSVAQWIALAGNPNTGKTTLFNALTGQRNKVSNYPGVTVDRLVGVMPLARGPAAASKETIELIDIPGTYSLVGRSAEEQIAIDNLAGIGGNPRPSAVIVCADATQLTRCLYLLLQIQELGIPTVVALTMVDEAGDATPPASSLSRALGCEVIPVTARTGAGLDELTAAAARAIAKPIAAQWRWQPSPLLAADIASVHEHLPTSWSPMVSTGGGAADALALWALQSVDPNGDDELVGIPPALRAAVKLRSPVETTGVPPVDDEVVHARWTWLDKNISPLLEKEPSRRMTERIDRVLLHRVVGFAFFIGVMFVLFMSLFAWADPMINAVSHVLRWFGGEVRTVLPAGLLADFLVDGVIGGLGTVLAFLPQLLLLFLFLGLLEDLGYLARVAYLMDRIMRSMNLSGRAFVPMLSGFACAVPAIAATRTMERRRDRILTMMVIPLMTCSARLPVYTLIIATLIPGSRTTQSLLMVGMYGFSIVTALIAAWVMSKTVKTLKAKRLPFVIELPPYRRPRLLDVLRMMWIKSSMFLREAGTVILACSIALWALLAFPRELPKNAPNYAAMIAAAPTTEAKEAIENDRAGERLRNSFGGRLGHVIEPVIAPLGFDWKIGIGIIGAFAAREVFISTMGVVFSVGRDADESSVPLRDAIRAEKKANGKPAYTPLMGLSLMIFFALACQCMSTLSVVKRETNSLRWPVFLFCYMTAAAYVVSLLVYQVGKLLGYG